MMAQWARERRKERNINFGVNQAWSTGLGL